MAKKARHNIRRASIYCWLNQINPAIQYGTHLLYQCAYKYAHRNSHAVPGSGSQAEQRRGSCHNRQPQRRRSEPGYRSVPHKRRHRAAPAGSHRQFAYAENPQIANLLLAPYWLDGHYLSAQTALRLGYKQVADAIRDEVTDFLARLPALINLLFNDRTPFVSEQTKQWLASSGSVNQTVPVVQTDEELQAAKACFDENGLEGALRYLENLPEGDPRHQFHRQFFGAQLLEEAGMVQLAQQQYRMLFRTGLHMMLSEWEPSLLKALEQKLTAEQ